jgi:hypothetical protein
MENLDSLIIRAQKGDLDAYSALVQRFQPMAFSYAIDGPELKFSWGKMRVTVGVFSQFDVSSSKSIPIV